MEMLLSLILIASPLCAMEAPDQPRIGDAQPHQEMRPFVTEECCTKTVTDAGLGAALGVGVSAHVLGASIPCALVSAGCAGLAISCLCACDPEFSERTDYSIQAAKKFNSGIKKLFPCIFDQQQIKKKSE